MKVIVNGMPRTIPNQTAAGSLPEYTGDNWIAVNGKRVSPSHLISEGDDIQFLSHTLPSAGVVEELLCKRYGKSCWQDFQRGVVGIAGLGGLGSAIAVLLARSGVGTLHLFDDDCVDITNVFRQAYDLSHLGMYKTEALRDIIARITPYTKVVLHTMRLEEHNMAEAFRNIPILCEAFDAPQTKAALANIVLSMPSAPILISASGMAGIGSSNAVQTKKITDRFYLCGDGTSSINTPPGLMAPRVTLCAAHQANLVLSLLHS